MSIPAAGHLISAYALGVVVGAPVLAFFGARWPRRALLVALMAAYGVFNALSAVATSFEMLMVSRFLDGFCMKRLLRRRFAGSGEPPPRRVVRAAPWRW